MAVLATEEMAWYCFSVIQSKLRNQGIPEVPSSIPTDAVPIFVCLKTLNGDLRGCIGNFGHNPLHEQLKSYALAAAFEDTRFNKVAERELPNLKCTVSLLHSFEPCRTWNDWEIGKHGIQIKLLAPGSSREYYGATYLPTVASEQGWNHTETMKSLVRKAGYRGACNEDLYHTIEVTRYQESSASATFQ